MEPWPFCKHKKIQTNLCSSIWLREVQVLRIFLEECQSLICIYCCSWIHVEASSTTLEVELVLHLFQTHRGWDGQVCMKCDISDEGTSYVALLFKPIFMIVELSFISLNNLINDAELGMRFTSQAIHSQISLFPCTNVLSTPSSHQKSCCCPQA